MPKKLCRICGKTLAEANEEDICFCHQEGMIIKEYTPVTGCTSYVSKGDDSKGKPNNMAFKPGQDGYNETAFDASVVGAIDENGEVYEIDLAAAENRVVDTEVYDHPDKIIDESEI